LLLLLKLLLLKLLLIFNSLLSESLFNILDEFFNLELFFLFVGIINLFPLYLEDLFLFSSWLLLFGTNSNKVICHWFIC
jgi:hypothetical protein